LSKPKHIAVQNWQKKWITSHEYIFCYTNRSLSILW
jgi:hypothetical protein